MFFTITAVALSGLLSLNPTAVISNYTQTTSAALDNSQINDGIKEEVVKDDRAARLNSYFAKWDMPLEGYGEKFVKEADKYGLDWKLMPAIGVQESSGGKYLKNNNPFGWGSAEIKFNNFNEAIEELAKNLGGQDSDTSRYYKDANLDDILWHYNGSVNKAYPGKIKYIMTLF